jgi:hypothetical protein
VSQMSRCCTEPWFLGVIGVNKEVCLQRSIIPPHNGGCVVVLLLGSGRSPVAATTPFVMSVILHHWHWIGCRSAEASGDTAV